MGNNICCVSSNAGGLTTNSDDDSPRTRSRRKPNKKEIKILNTAQYQEPQLIIEKLEEDYNSLDDE